MVTALCYFCLSTNLMNQDYLQEFRKQLTDWIEQHLASQRLPFQRLEVCPDMATGRGRLAPDIVLWINRDSQLAGSMILLPVNIDDMVIADGVAMAEALGLGHFTTWGAREVCIWRIKCSRAERVETFSLPQANKVQPEDFKWTLERLLDELKLVSVSTAPPTEGFSLYYYLNLCLSNLQELSPGLTDSTRLSAGQTADDEWVELAPVEKAWMSLWRVLFILWQKRLPPGLQPDRMEQVFHYAMADYTDDDSYLEWLKIDKDEAPLAEAEAVRLHHLAGRMSQLGWPANPVQADDLIGALSLP